MIILVIVGIVRGRKRGMSEELLDVLQWLCIVVLCALAYRPLGLYLADYTHMEVWIAFMTAYFAVAFVIILIFAGLKRAMGEKLVQADTFGGMEYYLGMIAGPIRFLSVLLVVLAFINGYYVSEADRARDMKWQMDSFGFRLVPTPGFLQQIIFVESASGKFVKKKLSRELIEAVPPGEKPETIAKRRERAVDEIIGK